MSRDRDQRGWVEEVGTAHAKPAAHYTLEWFWKNRYRPLKEPTWKPSSAPKMVWFIEDYVASPSKTCLWARLTGSIFKTT